MLLVLLLMSSSELLAIPPIEDAGHGKGMWRAYPFFDHVREDDLEEYELSDVIALAQAAVYHDIDEYTEEERKMLVDYHNIYRANTTGPIPSSADSYYMEYNRTLEWTAREYLRKCIMKHGWADDDNMTSLQGQNLYKGYTRHVSRPIYRFYMEYIWWYFNNDTCMEPYPRYICDHYNIMSWFNTSHVGGARRSYCFPDETIMIVSFHYLPKGNYVGVGFYTFRYGWPCTMCPAGHLCHFGLCLTERMCRQYNLDCACVRSCLNCGVPDWKRCRCECKAGWAFEDCSYPCRNEMDVVKYKKKVCQRWPIATCITYKTFLVGCNERCLLCAPLDKASQFGTCCGGKICEPYYVLDTNTCECKVKCPSRKCLYPPSTTTTTTTPISIKTTIKTLILATNSSNASNIELPKKEKKRPTAGGLSTFQSSHPPAFTLTPLIVWLLWGTIFPD